jgi:hypothetical protein
MIVNGSCRWRAGIRPLGRRSVAGASLARWPVRSSALIGAGLADAQPPAGLPSRQARRTRRMAEMVRVALPLGLSWRSFP